LGNLWFCEKCELNNGQDCGPWDDGFKEFKNILSIHKNHTGFQIGEPQLRGKNCWGNTEIERTFTEMFNQNIDRWFHVLVAFEKGPTKSCLLRGVLDEI
jgi:hypothetical protein